MARLSQPSLSQFSDPRDVEDYEAVIKRRTAIGMGQDAEGELGVPDLGEFFGALLNSPRLCAIAAQMGAFVRTAGERPDTYQHWEREIVDQVLSADWKTNVVQELHIPDGVAAGVRIEAVEAIRYGHEENLNDDERLLVRYIRQLIAGTVDDETFAALLERMGRRGVVEYSGFILWLGWIIRMMQMLQVHDPSDEQIDRIITGVREGTVRLPNFRERLG